MFNPASSVSEPLAVCKTDPCYFSVGLTVKSGGLAGRRVAASEPRGCRELIVRGGGKIKVQSLSKDQNGSTVTELVSTLCSIPISLVKAEGRQTDPRSFNLRRSAEDKGIGGRRVEVSEKREWRNLFARKGGESSLLSLSMDAESLQGSGATTAGAEKWVPASTWQTFRCGLHSRTGYLRNYSVSRIDCLGGAGQTW